MYIEIVSVSVKNVSVCQPIWEGWRGQDKVHIESRGKSMAQEANSAARSHVGRGSRVCAGGWVASIPEDGRR